MIKYIIRGNHRHVVAANSHRSQCFQYFPPAIPPHECDAYAVLCESITSGHASKRYDGKVSRGVKEPAKDIQKFDQEKLEPRVGERMKKKHHHPQPPRIHQKRDKGGSHARCIKAEIPQSWKVKGKEEGQFKGRHSTCTKAIILMQIKL